jgi:hypothetical protein
MIVGFLYLFADKLPYSVRILLESAIRNCDNFQVTKNDVEKILDWENTSPKQVEIPFKPARVILQVSLLAWLPHALSLLLMDIMHCSFPCSGHFYLKISLWNVLEDLTLNSTLPLTFSGFYWCASSC